jgi:hypothetical protein
VPSCAGLAGPLQRRLEPPGDGALSFEITVGVDDVDE